MPLQQISQTAAPPSTAERNGADSYLTVAEVAERLKVDSDTVRRLFLHEPGVLIICFPRKGKRLYRTVRIPEAVFQRVVTRLTNIV